MRREASLRPRRLLRVRVQPCVRLLPRLMRTREGARALARLRQNLARRNLHLAEHDGGSGPGAWAARLAGPKEIKEIENQGN